MTKKKTTKKKATKKAKPAKKKAPAKKVGNPIEEMDIADAVSSRWAELWDSLVAIELKSGVYSVQHTTVRAEKTVQGELLLEPVFDGNGKTPIGVVIRRINRGGYIDPRVYFIPDHHIKEYQFGDAIIAMTGEDQAQPVHRPAPEPDDGDEEILQTQTTRRKRAKPAKAVKTKPRKRIEDVIADEDTFDPDEDDGFDEMAAMREKMRQAEKDEEEYERVEAELDEEVLEVDVEEE